MKLIDRARLMSKAKVESSSPPRKPPELMSGGEQRGFFRRLASKLVQGL